MYAKWKHTPIPYSDREVGFEDLAFIEARHEAEKSSGLGYFEQKVLVSCDSADGKDSFKRFELTVYEDENARNFVLLSAAFVDDGVMHPISSVETSKGFSSYGPVHREIGPLHNILFDLESGLGKWRNFEKGEVCLPKNSQWCISVPSIKTVSYTFKNCR